MPSINYRKVFEEDWDELKAKIQFAASYHESWPNLISLFEQISSQNSVFIMIWNMITNQIVYTVDKRGVTGHPADKYLAHNGIYFSTSNMHPDSVDSIMTQQKESIPYFLKQSNLAGEKTVINLEGVYKKVSGKYFHFLQQSVCIETDGNGQPFLFLSYVYDFSHIKKHGTGNLVITWPGTIKWWNVNVKNNCLEPMKPLSRQEKIILSDLAEGKSSKEIAAELFISPFTVDTHRKNLLRKTNCVDTTGMVTYARLVGLM